MLPLQDLATSVCLTGPFPNHTLGQEEVGAKQTKAAPISDPICLFRIYFLSYALEYDHLYFCIISISRALELFKMADLLFHNCWCQFAAVRLFDRLVCIQAPIDFLIVIQKCREPLLTVQRPAFTKQSALHAPRFHLHLLWFLVFF